MAGGKNARIFEKSLELRAGNPEWVFYEGPPTANGKPGVHHVLARVFKDIYPRFKTMRGYHVGRKGGWDCHGLPVELEIEKRLGFDHKEQIETYGVAEFNRLCRESVTAYVDDWNRMTERIGMWLDLDDAYLTMTDGYIESVWWILAEFCQAGAAVRGIQGGAVLPPVRDGAVVARGGVGLSDGHRSVGVRALPAGAPDAGAGPRPARAEPRRPRSPPDGLPVSLLVWTTTPWTLISNVAAAVGADIQYARARLGDEYLILAADLVGAVLGPEATVEETFPGSALVGRRYRAPYEFVTPDKPAWRVIAADFVATDEGTGIVHIAPAFGADDMVAGQANDLPVIMPVDEEARFTAEVTPWAGVFVKDADAGIMDELESRGLLFGRQPYEHNYPHCWRCDTPLIYYAKTSWYVRTTARKEAVLAANEEVTWYPDHLKHGRFGKWLENNIDWSLSRDRYWGTPAAGVALRERPRHRGRLPGPAGRAGRPRPLRTRTPPSLRGRGHLRLPRMRRRGAPGGRGHRRLVRLRLHAGGAVALSLREPGDVGEALPGRLHLRGHRPDPGLVLQPARHQRAAHRPHLLPQRALPGPHPRQRRPQDVQTPGQRGRPLGHPRQAGRRRAALVPVHGQLPLASPAASVPRTWTR